ncbi:MAG: nitroreductase/quinone reductase family protein [Acidimicrobiales bacterium]
MTDSTSEQAKSFNQGIIDEFRANDGKTTGPFAGAPLTLITATGAKSGRQLTFPVVYTLDGDDVIVAASKAGAPTNPDWYHNLVANPEVTVELPGETFQARVEEAAGEERERLFAAHAAAMPTFAEYAEKTSRVIPVLRLKRI